VLLTRQVDPVFVAHQSTAAVEALTQLVWREGSGFETTWLLCPSAKGLTKFKPGHPGQKLRNRINSKNGPLVAVVAAEKQTRARGRYWLPSVASCPVPGQQRLLALPWSAPADMPRPARSGGPRSTSSVRRQPMTCSSPPRRAGSPRDSTRWGSPTCLTATPIREENGRSARNRFVVRGSVGPAAGP
jgi:hypothetical protein